MPRIAAQLPKSATVGLLTMGRPRSPAGSCTLLSPQPSCSVLIVPAKSEGRCEGEISITGVKKFFHAQRNRAEMQTCNERSEPIGTLLTLGISCNEHGSQVDGQVRDCAPDAPAPTSQFRPVLGHGAATSPRPAVKAPRQGVVCNCKKVRCKITQKGLMLRPAEPKGV